MENYFKDIFYKFYYHHIFIFKVLLKKGYKFSASDPRDHNSQLYLILATSANIVGNPIYSI